MKPIPYVFGNLLQANGFNPEFVSVHVTKDKFGTLKSIRLTYARPKSARFSARVEAKVIGSETYMAGWKQKIKAKYANADFEEAETLLLKILREAGLEVDSEPSEAAQE